MRGPNGPAELSEVVAAARRLRAAAGLPWDGFDVIAEGVTPADGTAAATVREWAGAGATWWIESNWSLPAGADGRAELHRRIEAGAPTR
jgi:hypothetical protein